MSRFGQEISVFNTQQGGIQNSRRNSQLIRHWNGFMENGCQNFSYVHISRKHWKCKYFTICKKNVIQFYKTINKLLCNLSFAGQYSRMFVYRRHLTMQSMRAWLKLSNYRRRSQKWYSINCGHDGHMYKTKIRMLINSFYSRCHDSGFSWSIKFSVDIFFSTDWMAICSMYTDSTLGI